MPFDDEVSKTILLVDDEKDFLELVGRALASRGYEVLTATNGEEALEEISITKPDLILLDIKMPKMGGVAFYDRICLPNTQPMYPVLIVSACENLEELFQHLPVEGFLVKPVKIDELLLKVKTIFEKKDKAELKKKDKAMNRTKQVLIVEEDTAIVTQLAMLFLNKGYLVSTFKTADQAIERLANLDLPDLILIKHGLSGDPEFSMTYYLRGIPNARSTKVAVYMNERKNLSPMKEKELIDFIGDKNLLELADLNAFLQRCEVILKESTKVSENK